MENEPSVESMIARVERLREQFALDSAEVSRAGTSAASIAAESFVENSIASLEEAFRALDCLTESSLGRRAMMAADGPAAHLALGLVSTATIELVPETMKSIQSIRKNLQEDIPQTRLS